MKCYSIPQSKVSRSINTSFLAPEEHEHQSLYAEYKDTPSLKKYRLLPSNTAAHPEEAAFECTAKTPGDGKKDVVKPREWGKAQILR